MYYTNRMDYQKIINLLDNTNTQPSKVRAKIWVEINDELMERKILLKNSTLN